MNLLTGASLLALAKSIYLAKLRWSGVVNFYCMQMSLVMSIRFLRHVLITM